MKILITGGTRGIGRACVERFARDGHRVAFFYHSRKQEAEEVGNLTGAKAFCVDIADPQAAAEGVRQAVAYLDGLDVLVNNAGISQIKLFTDLTDRDWHAMLNTDLSGAFFVTREAAKNMVAAHLGGRIINIGSMWGKVGASCEVHYSAAKAGLRGMTMALAKELGPSGITVNCVEPGVIATDMNRELSDDDLHVLCDETPLGRLGTPEEVAALVSFLASPEAAFITGQCIGIDGGFAV